MADTADVPLVIDDFAPGSIARVAALLERSTRREHFVYREAELDDLWRLIDMELAAARRDHRRAHDVARLEALLAITHEAHDLVGADEDPHAAAACLRRALIDQRA
jgi:hypothetical protein